MGSISKQLEEVVSEAGRIAARQAELTAIADELDHIEARRRALRKRLEDMSTENKAT